MADLEYARIITKSSDGMPTVPPSASHDDGAWDMLDIYEFELYIDSVTGNLFTRVGNTIVQLSTSGALTSILTNGSLTGNGTVANPLGINISLLPNNIAGFDANGHLIVPNSMTQGGIVGDGVNSEIQLFFSNDANNIATLGTDDGLFVGKDPTKADLVGGKVPASQLPTYVDDVLEFVNLAAFPVTGESGKMYVDLSNNKVYRWGGSTYVEISASPGSTDAVPEGATNKYFTESRVLNTILNGLSLASSAVITAADSVLSALGKLQGQITSHVGNTSNPHSVTKAQVGLGDVDNTSDIDKRVSTATTAALALKYDASNPSGFQTAAQVSTAVSGKEDSANKSNSSADSASTTKFPVWNAIVTYITGLFVKRDTALTVTGPTTLTSWEQLVLLNITADTTITLPTCAGNVGKELKFKRLDAGVFNVIFVASGAETVEVSANNLGFQNSTLTLQVSSATSSVQIAESHAYRNITVRRLTASGNYVAPRGLKYAIFEAVGGGAGGGGAAAGSATNVSTGGNGAAGGYVKAMLSATQLVGSIPYTIGAAGAAGVSNTTAPTAGGNTLLGTAGSFFTANGGGIVTTPVAQTSSLVVEGGVGGAFTILQGLDMGSIKGNNGLASKVDINGTRCNAYALGGGSSVLGVGGVSPSKTKLTTAANVQTGVAATGFGAGGSCGYSSGTAATAVNGGAGAAGIIIVTEYFD